MMFWMNCVMKEKYLWIIKADMKRSKENGRRKKMTVIMMTEGMNTAQIRAKRKKTNLKIRKKTRSERKAGEETGTEISWMRTIIRKITLRVFRRKEHLSDIRKALVLWKSKDRMRTFLSLNLIQVQPCIRTKYELLSVMVRKKASAKKAQLSKFWSVVCRKLWEPIS